jgi:phage terminase Nu1 subunit (DNA packaging protein)
MEVNQKELAQCLDISDRQIRNLKQDGLFRTLKNGRGYKLEECVKAYINYKINAEMGRRTSVTKEEVQAEHEEVKKQLSLLKLRALRRELHTATNVESFLSDMLIHFRNRILSLPPKMAMKLSGQSDINEMIQIIKKDLSEALEELSEYDPDEIDGLGTQTNLDNIEEVEEEEEWGDD